MKKIIYFFVSGLILFGCSSENTDQTTPEEGDPQVPVAVDDQVGVVFNTETIISDLLDNDTTFDSTTILSIDSALSNATIALNTDGTVTYTPQTDFTGTDTFTYTLCDDSKPEATCDTATVTITIEQAVLFTIPAELAPYYQNAVFSTDATLTLKELTDLVTESHTNKLSYGQRHNYLYDADEDENMVDNVILMYSGESRYWEEYNSGSNSYMPQTFNTEHVFPRSKLDNTTAVADLHHLRACDASINSQRSNFSFADGSGIFKVVNGNTWYPGDDWRGDVARMIMYVHTRYGDSFDKVGTLDLFLEWNVADPVSSIEKQRNTIIENTQGNRNPFIDNPYLATLIWGGTEAENTWK